MKTIQYHNDTKRYFKKFLKPNEFSDDENLLKYYDIYEDNIKAFVEKELGWNINIYFANINNSPKPIKEWFYIIENGQELYSSDEYEQNKLFTYTWALNEAIQCVFKNIYQINI